MKCDKKNDIFLKKVFWQGIKSKREKPSLISLFEVAGSRIELEASGL